MGTRNHSSSIQAAGSPAFPEAGHGAMVPGQGGHWEETGCNAALGMLVFGSLNTVSF